MPSNTSKTSSEKPVKEKRTHGLGITVFSAAILVVIVVTFIGAPVVSKVTEQPGYTYGNYDGINVDYFPGNAFAQQVEQLTRLYEQFNQGGNVDIQRQMVWRQAFEQTVMQTGLKREAERAGIVVTNDRITKELLNYPAYQKDGRFNQGLFDQTTKADQYKFSLETKTDLMVRQYANDHTRGALVSQSTKEFIAAMAFPQRKFSFVTFTDADYPQALVSDYATKNKNLFRSVDLSRITVTSSEGDAAKVRDEAVKGEKSFADLAKTYSKDNLAESGGALNIRHYYDLQSEISKAEDLDKVFSLAKGGISPLIKNEKGWTIYKVNVAAVDADLSSADTLALVRTYIARHERGLLEGNLESQAKAFAASVKNDFVAAAKKVGKTPATTSWVALNFGNHELFPSLTTSSKEATFQGLAANEDFFKKAFRLGQGEVSQPILASPSVLVVRVDEIKATPTKDDKLVTTDAVASQVENERSKQLQQSILTSPKFKDEFQTGFNHQFLGQ